MRYVYPILEGSAGTYYGIETKVDDVKKRFDELEKFRKERATRMGEKFSSQRTFFKPEFNGDQFARLLVEVNKPGTRELQQEVFMVYRSVI